jgi:predicted glycosyltransferase
MKIWIDFINTPQVTFFIPFIEDFRKNNHEILLTCRDSGNTVALLRQHELEFDIIGEGAGKGILKKVFLFPQRLVRLFLFIRKNKPDIAASQSSFYQPVVAKLLGIPCLYTNDNEHAKGNLFGFLFATRVVLPVALQKENFVNRWPLKNKVLFYPSVKEAIYLSQRSDLCTLTTGQKSKIYFRPEPWSAQYYSGPLNFFDETMLKLSKEFELTVLPRDKNQTEHYSQEKFQSLKVAQKPLSLEKIVSDCLLFIGAGGSMTREMAVLEIPVISVYQSSLLSVDRYLIEKGLMIINNNITFEEIKSFLISQSGSVSDWSVLKEGEQSFLLIKKLIYNLQNE